MTIKTNCVSLADFVTLRPAFIRDALSRYGWEAFGEHFEDCGVDLTDEIIDNVFQYYEECTPQEYIENHEIDPAYFENEEELLDALMYEGILLTSYDTYEGVMLIIDCTTSTPSEWLKDND